MNQKSKKSWISLLLVLALVVSLSSSVFAISSVISADMTDVNPGDTVHVSFDVPAGEQYYILEYTDGVHLGDWILEGTELTVDDEYFIDWEEYVAYVAPTSDSTYTIRAFGSQEDMDASTWDAPVNMIASLSIVFHVDSESAEEPQKRDPITVNTKVQTNDLSYLVAIPEQWMATTSVVEFWLDADGVSSSSEGLAYIATANNLLKSVGSSLLDTYQVDLMQRVTSKDGTTSEAQVAQDYVRGNFTVRLPIPAHLVAAENLGIVYIEADTGLTANLASKIVVVDGVSYIEFANNRSAVYGFVSDPNNAATR